MTNSVRILQCESCNLKRASWLDDGSTWKCPLCAQARAHILSDNVEVPAGCLFLWPDDEEELDDELSESGSLFYSGR